MKGITPIISIIVLLLITVSLAGAAYVFLGGYMTAYTGKALQVSNPGLCIGGREAFITVTNMGTQPINLGNCATVAQSGTFADCGDITVVRTDGGAMVNAGFDADTIAAAQPGALSKVTFRDPGCTSAGTPAVCKYAFTRAGELQAAEAIVSCSG